uniref:Uncharacterized protein n=1 Tax=Arundo donax TaxID=35708 RepID=A0A0A9E4F8_ARUDO
MSDELPWVSVFSVRVMRNSSYGSSTQAW